MNAVPVFPDSCTGCSACAAVCPTDAIVLSADPEGFFYPQVANSRCIRCGRCLALCPVLQPPVTASADPRALAAVSRDDGMRANSSSGGVFGVLARQILAQGGTVAGAAWAGDFTLHHVLIDKEADLAPLMGSKYVQSTTGSILRQIKEILTQSRPVLFCGTPCQVAGVRAFLGNAQGLFCVDLICHGVPSPLAWTAYAHELAARYQAPLRRVLFRAKTAGWRQSTLRAEFANGQIYEVSHRKDPYMWLFLKNMNLRSSCYQCHFKGVRRCSDLTLADFWGAERQVAEMDDDQGISLVLVQSAHGEDLFLKCQEELQTLPVVLQEAVADNPLAVASVACPAGRETFFSLVGKQTAEQIIKAILTDKERKNPLFRLKKLLGR